jgi:IS30 family transposase
VTTDSHGGRSSRPFRFAKDRRKRKTERFLAIGNGDLLSGAKNSYMATLVERHSCHADQGAQQRHAVVVAALSKQVRKLPATLRRSLTWDRGLEMANLLLRSTESLAAWD